ncbi:uncharacterized aarF domain-containing protein kinase 5-like isoform X2 [Paramacrobiotus metropolitanus]|nr:uncharacterized aarF domain-containing protein kinase 5-like isoform X2 [Paramacrobiotus metropolitanus]
MGQAVSAAGMANMVPKEFATKLQVLQDQALVMRPDELDDLFLEDFGAAPEDLFSSLNRTPIAAASLAQVFRATTKDGMDVAVKCQYLDLRDRYDGDIRTVEMVFNVLHWLFPQFMGHWIFGEVKGTLAMELDFVNEGRNSEKCARDLSHLPFLYVPKVLWQLTSDRVLTTEFIDHAAKITEVDKIRKMGLSVADVNKNFLTIFGEQVFRSGFVHADPHPGNIFIRPDKSGHAQIVLLDHGLYETIPEDVRISICHIFKATVLADHTEMQLYSDKIGMPDYKLFASILVGRPIGQGKKVLLGLKKEFSKADMEAFRAEMEGMVDKIQATVKAMPKSLFLVMRNMNLVRAICVVHGNPHDRYTMFARLAAQAVMDDTGVRTPSLKNSAAAISERLHFEWKLLMHYVYGRMFLFIVKILTVLGVGPFSSGFGPPGNFGKPGEI